MCKIQILLYFVCVIQQNLSFARPQNMSKGITRFTNPGLQITCYNYPYVIRVMIYCLYIISYVLYISLIYVFIILYVIYNFTYILFLYFNYGHLVFVFWTNSFIFDIFLFRWIFFVSFFLYLFIYFSFKLFIFIFYNYQLLFSNTSCHENMSFCVSGMCRSMVVVNGLDIPTVAICRLFPQWQKMERMKDVYNFLTLNLCMLNLVCLINLLNQTMYGCSPQVHHYLSLLPKNQKMNSVELAKPSQTKLM